MLPVKLRTPHIHLHWPSPRSGPISVNELSRVLNLTTSEHCRECRRKIRPFHPQNSTISISISLQSHYQWMLWGKALPWFVINLMVNYGYIGEYDLVQFLLVHDVNEAASSQWTRFFMRLEDNPCWCSDDFHQTFTILREMNRLTYSTSAIILSKKLSTLWITLNGLYESFIVFVRHPKPRLLSAFLDKAVFQTEHFGNFTCQAYTMRVMAKTWKIVLKNMKIFHSFFWTSLHVRVRVELYPTMFISDQSTPELTRSGGHK